MNTEKRRELLCNLVFDLTQFLSNLTFEGIIEILKEEDEIKKKRVRIMRNNLINWLRQDPRFIFLNSNDGKDVVVVLSKLGGELASKKSKADKVVMIRRHVSRMVA